MTIEKHTLAFFVTPHGFGHAARASAVMAAMAAKNPAIRFEIFTRVPQWFFEHTLAGHYSYHSLLTDIGLVQRNSLTEDLPETVRQLDALTPFVGPAIESLAAEVRELGCEAVLCDIAPMGIAVARAAGVPSILLENFTWDWIYEGYFAEEPALEAHADYLRQVFAAADYRIQTEPFCLRYPHADLTTLPISRRVKTPRDEIRRALQIAPEDKVVLITMGGTHWDYDFLHQLEQQPEYTFIIPGGVPDEITRRDNLALLPHHSPFFHPDLINASDAVVGKVGYSTLAEVYHAGVPYGYVIRERFVESHVLVDYIERNIQGVPIDAAKFEDGSWPSALPQLLSLLKVERAVPNGSEQAADFVIETLWKK